MIATIGELFGQAVDAFPKDRKGRTSDIVLEVYDADRGMCRTIHFETTPEGVRLVIGGQQ